MYKAFSGSSKEFYGGQEKHIYIYCSCDGFSKNIKQRFKGILLWNKVRVDLAAETNLI